LKKSFQFWLTFIFMTILKQWLTISNVKGTIPLYTMDKIKIHPQIKRQGLSRAWCGIPRILAVLEMNWQGLQFWDQWGQRLRRDTACLRNKIKKKALMWWSDCLRCSISCKYCYTRKQSKMKRHGVYVSPSYISVWHSGHNCMSISRSQ
jgi:hypothetical protein